MLFLLLLLVCDASSLSTVEVDTPLGRVQGVESSTETGSIYYSFDALPYAQPPVGKRRFKAPVPLDPWEGVLKSTSPPDDRRCLQNFFGHLEGSEDCLYLHIWTPVNPAEVKKPLSVMVYIHGGAFIGGAGGRHFIGDPDLFMEKGVMLVGINYRLGPFGFLSTEDAATPGNYGLLDQVEALKWIHNNIAAFGGNPDDVTIFGMSAGGVSVHAMVLTPLTKGLFHRAISHSGSALTPWARTNIALKRAQRVGEKLGCSTGSKSELMKCLREKDGGDIMDASLPDDHEKWGLYPFTWTPRVDVESDNPVLPKTPMDLMTLGEYNKVTYITGFNRDEGLWVYPPTPFFTDDTVKAMYNDWDRACRQLLNTDEFSMTKEEFQEVCTKTRDHYIDEEKLEDVYDTRYIQLAGDTQFNAGTIKTARLMSKHHPVYMYTFDFFSKKTNLMLHFNEKAEKVLRGVHHADEVMYLFNHHQPEIKESPEKEMTEIMSTVWTNFAKTGTPTFPDPSIRWTTTTPGNRQYMSLNLNSEMKENYRRHDMDFWDEMFENTWFKVSKTNKDEL